MWFKKLTGFQEESPEQLRTNIFIEGELMHSRVNNKSFRFGRLDIPTLEELRKRNTEKNSTNGNLILSETVGDVLLLHLEPENKHALFQAASQFNLLEMVGPHITPEQGIDIYEQDFTQGPACAIACGAATIYRNYFVPIQGKLGQDRDRQIDCLELLGRELWKEGLPLWEMRNGYALPDKRNLQIINNKLLRMTEREREYLKGKLRIGLQWDTEVTLEDTVQIVSQAYCSALPVAYSGIDANLWEPFARLILEASYEATLHAASINLRKSNIVYLTLVGGGAFGNDLQWIMESMVHALNKFKHTPLDVRIVSFGLSNPKIQDLLASF